MSFPADHTRIVPAVFAVSLGVCQRASAPLARGGDTAEGRPAVQSDRPLPPDTTRWGPVEHRVVAIIASELHVPLSAVLRPGATLTRDLGAGSLDFVELIMELEKEFDVDIPDDLCERMDSVEVMIRSIRRMTDAARRPSGGSIKLTAHEPG